MARQRRKRTKPRRKKQAVKQTDRVHNPHDSFFHKTFSQKEHAQEFLSKSLPEEIVTKINLKRLALKRDKYTDDQLQSYITDLLFEVPLNEVPSDQPNAPLSIYCLYEHKSKPEADLPFQILRYMLERLLADQIDKQVLRPVVVLVFYHGKEDWTIPTQFQDLFKGVAPVFRRFIPKFEYILFDMSAYTKDKILTMIESGSLQASLLLLNYIYDEKLSEMVEEILEPLARAKDLPPERVIAHLEAILRYMTGIQKPVPDPILNRAVNRVFSEGDDMVQTIVDRWKEEGRVEGINIGRVEGINIGRVEGINIGRVEGRMEGRQEKQREFIGMVLNQRFQLNEQERQQLAKRLAPIQSEETLDRIINLALTTTTPDFISFMGHLILSEDLLELSNQPSNVSNGQ